MKPELMTLRVKIIIMALCTGFGSEVSEFDPQKRDDSLFLAEPTSTFWLIQSFYVTFISHTIVASSSTA